MPDLFRLGVHADWLDEHGEPEIAQDLRRLVTFYAEQYAISSISTNEPAGSNIPLVLVGGPASGKSDIFLLTEIMS